MKCLKYIILLIIFLPLNTYAIKEEVIINCPDNIKKGTDFDCSIIGYAPYEVSAIEYEFSLPSYIKKKDFKVDSIWQGEEEDNLVILYTDVNKKSPFNIGTITLNSNKNIDYVDIKTTYLLLGDDEYNAYTIIDRENVKKTESKEEKTSTKKNNSNLYVIIILIIVVISLILFKLKKRKVKK